MQSTLAVLFQLPTRPAARCFSTSLPSLAKKAAKMPPKGKNAVPEKKCGLLQLAACAIDLESSWADPTSFSGNPSGSCSAAPATSMYPELFLLA